ncbi:hypothetical protein M1O56_05430 [Dehalococcoidia bacterium]|nr:hypothetical protein [Dehalococcoidia bacterium]
MDSAADQCQSMFIGRYPALAAGVTTTALEWHSAPLFSIILGWYAELPSILSYGMNNPDIQQTALLFDEAINQKVAKLRG